MNLKHMYKILVPKSLTWSVCVKSDVKLAVAFARLLPLIFGKVSVSKIKVVWYFARFCSNMHRTRGPKGLALYLKACCTIVQQVAGGMQVKSPWVLGANIARTKSGIPRLIPHGHRQSLLAGDVGVIRLWLSLLGLYRVIEFKGALKLKTITEPGKEISQIRREFSKFWGDFLDSLEIHTSKVSRIDPSRDLDPKSLPPILKASPCIGGSTSVCNFVIDSIAIYSDTEYYSALKEWLVEVDGLDLLWALKSIGEVYHRVGLDVLIKWWGKPLLLGRLGFLEEPGKIRVVAMVPLLIQGIMKPLHDWIFSRLRVIVTDGTFNQIGPVRALLDACEELNIRSLYSYDLSAATDRLPVDLQVDLLSEIMGNKLALLWKGLLVSRPYRLPKIAKSYNLGFNEVKYEVGQPMGALSSWAMLALTHHAIVQFAASRVKAKQPKGWFTGYAVLGDDIVISNELVAAEYLRIMDDLGVQVGLAKSLISKTRSLEFAKRTFIRGRDCSPVSLAEVSVSLVNLQAAAELFAKCRGFIDLKLSHVARFAGFGYKNLAQLQVGFSLNNRLSRLLAYLCRPGGLFPMPLEAWLSSIGPGGQGVAKDHRYWVTSERLWRLSFELVSRSLTKSAEVVRQIFMWNISETKTSKGKLVNPIFGEGNPLSAAGSIAAFNVFMNEWVAYPLGQRLRKRLEVADDAIRVLEPGILPDWESFEALWTQIIGLEDGASALPTKWTFSKQDPLELKPSTRLVTLWVGLRKLILRERAPVLSLRPGSVQPRKATRRRRIG